MTNEQYLSLTLPVLLQILDRHRLNRVGQFESEDPRIKIEFSVERSLDVRGLPESVLLALEGDVSHRQPLGAQGIDHHLGLIRRHDLVFQTLKEYHRRGQQVCVMYRRPDRKSVV